MVFIFKQRSTLMITLSDLQEIVLGCGMVREGGQHERFYSFVGVWRVLHRPFLGLETGEEEKNDKEGRRSTLHTHPQFTCPTLSREFPWGGGGVSMARWGPVGDIFRAATGKK